MGLVGLSHHGRPGLGGCSDVCSLAHQEFLSILVIKVVTVQGPGMGQGVKSTSYCLHHETIGENNVNYSDERKYELLCSITERQVHFGMG